MRIGIGVCKTGKARRGVGVPARREDERELMYRAWETRVPKRARKPEVSERRDATSLDLTVEDEKGGRPAHRPGQPGPAACR